MAKYRGKRLTRQDLIDVLNGNGTDRPTFGQRMADRIAAIGGSWGFICSFMLFLVLWVVVNSVHIFAPFDPYPFILLNLILSCVAAIQAPIIMMSQNRLDAKDREMSRKGLRLDMKAAHDIEMLNGKLDRLIALLDGDIENDADGYGD